MSSTTIAVTSDLLLGASTGASIDTLIDALAGSGADAVVLAGNIGENDAQLIRFFKQAKLAMACPIAFIPGNHSLFFREDITSEALLTGHLARLCKDYGIHYLPGNPFQIGALALAGSLAWYDYSAADPTAHLSLEDHVQFRQEHNIPEALRIDWGWSDREVADSVSTLLAQDIQRLESDPNVTNILVVTHFPVFDWQIPRDPGNRLAGLRNAYQGNLTVGRYLLGREKVRGVVSGHVPSSGCRILHRDPLPPMPTWLVGSTPDSPAFTLARIPKAINNG